MDRGYIILRLGPIVAAADSENSGASIFGIEKLISRRCSLHTLSRCATRRERRVRAAPFAVLDQCRELNNNRVKISKERRAMFVEGFLTLALGSLC